MKRFLTKAFLLVIGSAAALVAADSLIFAYGTFDGSTIVASLPNDEDITWWKNRVGAEPKPSSARFSPPEAPPARAGTWFHKNGGMGAAGFYAIPAIPYRGMIAYEIEVAHASKYPMIQGRALASEDKCAYRMGVALPYVMVERSFVCAQGASPPHPAEGGWQTRIVPAGFAANVGLLVAIVAMPILAISILLRDGRSIIRIARSRCARCGYILLKEQDRCPECGANRMRIWSILIANRNTARTG